jgi:multicomponent Na+:H+ antiporter subunit C
MNELFAIATGIMFALGVFQLLRRDLIKVAIGFYILFTAINLFFLAAGAFDGNVPPYAVPHEVSTAAEAIPNGQTSDPMVQALILTAIVISFGSYALLLGMINIAARRYQSLDVDDVRNLKH